MLWMLSCRLRPKSSIPPAFFSIYSLYRAKYSESEQLTICSLEEGRADMNVARLSRMLFASPFITLSSTVFSCKIG
ncbi:hypothetical protein D3C80_2003090 [compost metagenome]